jgi:hypothetical protein
MLIVPPIVSPRDPRAPEPLPQRVRVVSGPFSEPIFAFSHRNVSHSESSDHPTSSSAKSSQPQTRIKLPIHYERELRHEAFLLGPGDLGFGPLEPTSLGLSPALAGLTNRGDGQFQPAPALLPSPLEDTDSPPPGQPSDLITLTPKIIQNRTGYFGRDALDKLKQNWPVRSGRGSTVSVPHPQNNMQWAASRHGAAAAQDVGVIGLPGNDLGSDSPDHDFRS